MSNQKERKSPAESATLFELGVRKRGQDGNMWCIVETKTGVKRWQKVKSRAKVDRPSISSDLEHKNKRNINIITRKSKSHSYLVHDNGSRPFRVCIQRKCVTVYKVPKSKESEFDDDYDEMTEAQLFKFFTEKILEFQNVQQIFIGCHPKESDDKLSKSFSEGNSILLNTKGLDYIFIGMCIYSFSTTEPILHYYSEIGNNDVPYPTALSKNYVYLMIESCVLPKSAFPDDILFSIEAYPYYYGHEGEYESQKKNYKIMKEQSSKLQNYHILVDRL